MYVNLGFAAIAKLLGMVQGVVVQIMISSFFINIFLPLVTLKAT
jgi:hypothetical protein